MTLESLAYITTGAALLYGLGTLLLWWENRQDRIQRQEQFQKEVGARKLDDLYRAFYEAWGYWNGQAYRSPDARVDASQTGRLFEALIRLECQLRLNDYRKEANDLGWAVRTLEGVDDQLSNVGTALGLITPDYRNPDLVKAKVISRGQQG